MIRPRFGGSSENRFGDFESIEIAVLEGESEESMKVAGICGGDGGRRRSRSKQRILDTEQGQGSNFKEPVEGKLGISDSLACLRRMLQYLERRGHFANYANFRG